MSVIIPIPAGQRTSAFSFSVISGPAAHLIPDYIGSVKHQRERGGISGPWRGAGCGDKNITGNPPHLMQHTAESWGSHLYKQEVCSALFVCMCERELYCVNVFVSLILFTILCNLSPTFQH